MARSTRSDSLNPILTLATGLVRDLRLAWRSLTRRPGFFALVVLVLAAGMGSAVAAFGILEAAQLRPLPFTAPDELVQIALAHEGRPLEAEPIYRQDLLAFAERRDVIARVGAFTTGSANLSDGDRAERYDAASVTPDLFPLLGVQPATGRSFIAADSVAGAPAVVLISDLLWRVRYASAPAIVGREIRVDRRPATIVGVMPPGFAFPYQQQLWTPLPDVVRDDAADRSEAIGIARMAAGSNRERLDAALSPLLEESRRRHPERYEGYHLRVQPLSWFFNDWQARAGQRLLFLAVLAMLCIAMANAAGLLLAHARGRENEWALRTALGAPRTDRLFASLATGLIVSATALILALPFASAALKWIEGELLQSEDPSPYFLNLGLTPMTVTFAVGATILAAVVSGLLPGLKARSAATLAGDGSRVAGSRAAARIAGAIVAVQVALSVTVVITMAVLVQGIESMGRRDIGVNPGGLLTARLALPNSAYPLPQDRAAFWAKLVDVIGQEPGLTGVTIGSAVPGFTGGVDAVYIEGAESRRDVLRVATAAIDHHFLDTYRIPVVAGRGFSLLDDAAAPGVALVDRRFAEAAWPGRSPIGRRIRVGDGGTDWVVVVGLVENLHLAQVDDPPRATVLAPLAQHPPRFASIAVRTSGDPYQALALVRRALQHLDADLPLFSVYSLPDAIRHGYYNVRIFGRLIGWLGTLALLMTAAGLYGLIAGRVAQRTREIGVRRALGASGLAVGRSVVAQIIVPLGTGALFGVVVALPIARALVAIEPTVLSAGSGVYGAAIGTIATAAALALAAPLVRALAINPVEALRHE